MSSISSILYTLTRTMGSVASKTNDIENIANGHPERVLKKALKRELYRNINKVTRKMQNIRNDRSTGEDLREKSKNIIEDKFSDLIHKIWKKIELDAEKGYSYSEFKIPKNTAKPKELDTICNIFREYGFMVYYFGQDIISRKKYKNYKLTVTWDYKE